MARAVLDPHVAARSFVQQIRTGRRSPAGPSFPMVKELVGMQRGFTLVEMLVVLTLLGLAAALVAPAILPARHTDASQFAALVAASRDAALRRAEVIWLRVERSGAWRLDGDASAAQGAVATGRLDV